MGNSKALSSGPQKTANLSAVLFLSIATLNGVYIYSKHLVVKQLLDQGFAVDPPAFLNEHVRYLLVIGAMVLLLAISRKARSIWLQITAALVLAILVLQCFLILNYKFDRVRFFEYGGLYANLSLLGDALMLVLGIYGGTGLLLNSFRKGSD
ncbi:MAG: hypothetical protein J5I65_11560 [Aridibacter famidurans]|nr:hypothetical protein [Aridibacter famidurans]